MAEQSNERQKGGDELLGETVDGRFQLEDKLGEGAVGRVYRATQLSIERSVALKMLHGDFRRDDEYQKRFLREAKVISGFNHPNIVRLIDYGEDQARHFSYLVMEFVEGIELGELVSRGRFKPEFAFEVTHQIAGGLFAAHQQNIIHRDLKAENIILVPVPGGTFQAKILDFGVALPRNTSTRLTSAGDVFGTPAYMSPEQAEGDRELGQTADLYSLGVLLFEMLTGALPFQQSSTLKMMVAQIEKEPPTPSDVVPNASWPASLDRLVLDLLAKSPADRPQSGDVLRTRIDDVREEAGWSSIDLDTETLVTETFQPWIEESSASLEESSLPSEGSEDDDTSVAETLGADSSILEETTDEESNDSVEPRSATALDGTSTPSSKGTATDASPPSSESAPQENHSTEVSVEWGGGTTGGSWGRVAFATVGLLGLAVVSGGASYWMGLWGEGAESATAATDTPAETSPTSANSRSESGAKTAPTPTLDAEGDTRSNRSDVSTGTDAEPARSDVGEASAPDTPTSPSRVETSSDDEARAESDPEPEPTAGSRPSEHRRVQTGGVRESGGSRGRDEAETLETGDQDERLPSPSTLTKEMPGSAERREPSSESPSASGTTDETSPPSESGRDESAGTASGDSTSEDDEEGGKLEEKIEQQEQKSWQWQ